MYSTCMELSTPSKKRWVIEGVDPDAPYLAKRLAAKYQVHVADVVLVALFELQEWLQDGGEIPDGWRTV